MREYRVHWCASTESAQVVDSSGRTHETFPTSATRAKQECKDLAARACADRNGVGETFELQRWVPPRTIPGITPGHYLRAHWRTDFKFATAQGALDKRDQFRKEDGTDGKKSPHNWRAVRVTREIL